MEAPRPQALRRAFAARLRDEGLTDWRLGPLERWVARLPDERVAEAIEMIAIGLDAPRRARWEVLWVIERSFKRMDAIARETRVAFLRWVVASRASRATVAARLQELEAARPERRDALVAALSGEDAGSSLANAHAILAQAWRAAPPHARPRGEVHRGEHPPSIGDRGSVRGAAFVARKVAHLAPRGRRRDFHALVALAEEAAETGAISRALDRAVEDGPREGALGVARSACAEARAALRRRERAGTSARAAAADAVGLLLEADGHEAVRELLEALDAELRRLDVEHALALRKKSASSRIASAVHRGLDAEGKPAIWIARIRDHDLGLLVKHGRSWTWSEGPHDEILAMVPDEHFERAVMAAKRELRP